MSRFDLRDAWSKREQRREQREQTPKELKKLSINFASDPYASVTNKPSKPMEWNMSMKEMIADMQKLGLVDMDISPFGRVIAVSPPVKPKPKGTGVNWDDIVGQLAAKTAMREAIELPIKHADVFKRFGRKAPKGVLLYGPPGNGKTMLAKAAANSVIETYGDAYLKTTARPFISVKGPELENMYVGETERNIRNLFAEAQRHKNDTGFPSIIFIDEAEAILTARGTRAHYNDGPVQAFLTEMDGFGESAAIVILATNRPDVLDPAIVRDGRIDRRVFVGCPTKDDATEMMRKRLVGRPLLVDTLEEVAAAGADALFSGKHVLYRAHLVGGATRDITLGDVTSGAQITDGIIERATTRAIDRVIKGGLEGITAADLQEEVKRTLTESKTVTHLDAIFGILEGLNYTHVCRVTATAETAKVATPALPLIMSSHVGQA